MIWETSNALNSSSGSVHLILMKSLNMKTNECEICSSSFVRRTEKTPPVSICGIASLCKFRFRFFMKSHQCRRILCIRSWPLNENEEFSQENTKLVMSKKSAWIEFKCESHVCSFSSILKELFKLSSCLYPPQWPQNTTKVCYNAYEKPKTARKVEEQICVAQQHSVSHVSCHLPVFGW